MARRILNSMKHSTFPILMLVLWGAVGCGKLRDGVVREIDFPEHEPQIALTFMARPGADTLVARAQASAGILDSVGSKRIEEAIFTLTHASGVTVTWGGSEDWVNGLGHVLTDPEITDGWWTLHAEAPNFEPVTATQLLPPRIDSVGTYAYGYAASLEDSFVEVDPAGWTYVSRTIELTLDLPDRVDAEDHFLVRAQKTFNWQDEGSEEAFGGYVVLNPQVDDDPRIVWNQLCSGYLLQDIASVEALTGLPFQVFQEAWGPDSAAVLGEPLVLEVCAISPEMALYYERLDMISNPSGGPLFTEPVLAYSNVSSGYGCFGLYTSSTLPLTFD